MLAFYTGIGSRATPEIILKFMSIIASKLDAAGWTLRSGGARGADYAFESGATKKQIYLPWKDFNGNKSLLYSYPEEFEKIASKFHPNWGTLSSASKLLHTRNVAQILGRDQKNLSTFLICWTPDGAYEKTSRTTGGTGQAIRIANHYGIPVFNLKNKEHLKIFVEWVKSVEP